MSEITQREERRRTTRSAVAKDGKLFVDNFNIVIDCQIDNESEAGMSLLLDRDDIQLLPKQISLLDKKTGSIVDADVIWRNGDRAGVQFRGKMTAVEHLPGADIRRLSIIATRRLSKPSLWHRTVNGSAK
ncbi:PilZ domain-containing protein [Cohaesibacter haloalkalitolerans]|uniref:PilZ domain-containing protein n=1 Tax=Cohaesibacter haloalkalitolerans TaxID=1162980 RepID=UPI000E65AA08|nr:PilZ domain-containing protein [Cohaesibacter haloalkalitolerans]